MLAQTGVHRTGSRVVAEVKYDGCRGIVAVDGHRIRARSRPGSSMVGWFPELGSLAKDLAGRRVVLDGEVIAADPSGRPDFGRLQRRIGRTPRRLVGLDPVRFVAFDVLSVDGSSVCDRPWQQRRELLEELGESAGPQWQVAPVFDDIDAAVDATSEFGLEGVVVKDRSAPYRPGQRTRAWIKVKHTTVSRFVVGGLATTSRCRDALLVGDLLPDGRIAYRGCVEVGTAKGRRAEAAHLLRQATTEASPFDSPPGFSQVVWVEPLLIVEVRHLGTTRGGRLREPMLMAPVDVVRGGL
ncbi:RNA ligase family protein [Iamia majanohamensis]|uniref:DNA ligase (ATP) n=1 Tax=Iamia majanohamensis TaxID=467976 RepID=A0AAF0BXL8_9ACTN|nr:RNA ligase family protein [Iamia majanohamensis]WCO69250.1 RNA ligase family protein [Iamia majanohamensis]